MILRRLGGSRFSEVLPAWNGCAVVIIGGGPSLALEQVALVKQAHDDGRVRCIAVNDAYLWAPWADVNYFADASWWVQHNAGVAKPALGLTAHQVRERFAAFRGEKCSIQSQAPNIADDAVHILRNKTHPLHSNGLSLDPTMIVTGRHGGYQACNLAILAGAKTIILLGMDGREAKDGKTHFHGGHRDPTPQDAYSWYRKAWSEGEAEMKAAGVKVLNATPGTAIDTFPKVALADALARSLETA